MAAPDHHFRLVCRVEGGREPESERAIELPFCGEREKGRIDARFCGAADERGREERASFLESLCKNEEGERQGRVRRWTQD